MQMIEINKLKEHPRNQELFDDIEGQRWNDFKESIQRRGVVEPCVVTQDLIIVSGHQRVKACKELGINNIPCRITHYDNEDMILEDLISTNIMQRGVGNVNPIKMARCIIELERIKGIRKGGDRKSKEKKLPLISQKDLAKEFNVTQIQLRNIKSLLTLIPELQDLIETGELKPSIGYTVLKKLSKEEQEEIITNLGADKLKEMTQKEVKQYIEENNKLKEELKNPKIVEKIIDNTNYNLEEENKSLKKQLELKEKLIDIQKEEIKNHENIINSSEEVLKEYKKDSDDLNALKKQIELATKEKNDINREISSTTELSGLIFDIGEFLKTKLCPINYSRAILEQGKDSVVINNLSEIVSVVKKWVFDMERTIEKNTNNYKKEDIIDVECDENE